MLCSLFDNNIGDEGASALAAVLKETQITTVKCAAAPEVFAFVSAPLDTSPSPIAVCSTTRLVKARMRSCLSSPRCRRSSASAAPSPSRRTSTSRNEVWMLRMRSCSRLTCQGTTLSGRSCAPPAHKVFAFVSAPVDTPHHQPLPCSQSARKRPRP